MKRLTAWFTALALCLALLPLGGCDSAPPTPMNTAAFRLSSLDDVTGKNGTAAYRVTAPYTDSYTLTCSDGATVAVYDGENCLAEDSAAAQVALTAGQEYILRVTTDKKAADFTLHCEAQHHRVTLPYDVTAPSNEADAPAPATPAVVDYQKREGGTYIYSNNPELLPPEAVGDALIRTKDLTGEVFFTFEHANYAGTPFYLGYQLQNDGDEDVFVTVTNIGYQAGGTWFGQTAWYDFYNTAFALPEDYLTASGAIAPKYRNFEYAYENYTPRVFQPTTYRLPAGEYFWVIGGTAADAYRHINVDNTADKPLGAVKCANGNVKFEVTGGAVTATFYAYDDIAQVERAPEASGYRTKSYASQYVGTANHRGVIDNAMAWTFDDTTASGALPVTYTTSYDENAAAVTVPYAAYNNTPHTVVTDGWMSHLNPQNDHRAVGTDMVTFSCMDDYGRAVMIDNAHADGGGNPANTANWMIEYQEQYTFVNEGDTSRTVTLGLEDNGTLAVLMRDSQTGEVLDTAFTTGLAEEGASYTYDITVAPHNTRQITLCYVLVACSYGNVWHTVTLT